MPAFAVLHYDFKAGLRNSVVDEAKRRAVYIFGKENVRLEGFDYQPYANAADEAREGGSLSLSTPAGRFTGIAQIRAVFPLPEEVRDRKMAVA